MEFLIGYVVGVVIGIGLIVGFALLQNMRTKQRTYMAEALAALARMTVEDSRKIIPDQYYPSWLVFSKMQKLGWLNKQLEKAWPYVDEAGSDLLRNSLEPLLEQYKPAILSSLEFSKFSLGSVPPKLTGVCIVDGEGDEVIMELEVQWDGTPKVILEVATKVGVALPVQVKNVEFTGVFRLIFKPLVDDLPCFGAVCYSLREKKHLDFSLKVVGGNVSKIPGISDALEEMIRDAIEDSITWPMRQIMPIIPGDYSYLELKPSGILEVKLIEAKELSNKDLIGKSDPLAELFVRPLRARMKTSKTINNDTNPIWNEHFEFLVEDLSTQFFTVRIYDDEGIQASELIGCAQLPLKELEPGKVKDVWLKLVKELTVQRDQKNRGQVHLELLYYPMDAEKKLSHPFDPEFRLTEQEKVELRQEDGNDSSNDSTKFERRHIFVRGVLSVTVFSAENLPAKDLMGKSDPFVVLTMKKSEQKKKTRVLNNTSNPVWNQTFDFVVEDALHELLVIEVYDHDMFGKGKIGRCATSLTRPILEKEFKECYPLVGTDSGKLNLQFKWTPQNILRDGA